MRGIDSAAYDADRVTGLTLAKADVREALRRQVEGFRRLPPADVDLLGGGLVPAHVDLVFDVLSAKSLFGKKSVVRAASNADIGNVSGSTERAGVDVIDLEEGARLTPVTAIADERALFSVALDDFPPGRLSHTPSLRCARFLGARRLSKSLLFEAGDQEIESLLEDDGEIAFRISMPHELGGALDLVAKLAARGQLELVALLSKGLDVQHEPPPVAQAHPSLSSLICLMACSARVATRVSTG